jgi:hypothetical protein
VAVVVPLSSRTELLPEEKVSLRHVCHFLAKYDKYLVVPSGSSFSCEGFDVIPFPRKFFGSVTAHNHLLLWPAFYETFRDYEYILIYHLDSLVFSDDLLSWCKAGWDYIGAPWLPCADTPWVHEAQVGNGGFTLMKVESVLQVLYNRYRQKPASYWADLLIRNANRTQPLFKALERLERVFSRSNTLQMVLECWRSRENAAAYGNQNDAFWSTQAGCYLPGFKVATVDEGLRFAFEAAPRVCFELNQRRLPLGCHAWAKYDRQFWEPYLLPGSDGTA